MSDTMLEDQNDKEEQRQIRLEKERHRIRSIRRGETEQQRQNRLKKERDRSRSSRMDGTEQQRQSRLEKERERKRSGRMEETEEQRQSRLQLQRKRSQENRAKKKIEKRTNSNISRQQQTIQMQFTGTEEQESCDGNSSSDLIPNENVIMKNRNPNSSSWPEPISRDLKEDCLKKFVHRMSMSTLAETTCAVCNVRTPVQKSKSVPVSKITGIELLKVSDETKALIMSTQLSNLQHKNQGTVTTVNDDDDIEMIDHAQSNIHLFVSEDFF